MSFFWRRGHESSKPEAQAQTTPADKLKTYLVKELGFKQKGLNDEDLKIKMRRSDGENTEVTFTLSERASAPQKQIFLNLAKVLKKFSETEVKIHPMTAINGSQSFTREFSLDEMITLIPSDAPTVV